MSTFYDLDQLEELHKEFPYRVARTEKNNEDWSCMFDWCNKHAGPFVASARGDWYFISSLVHYNTIVRYWLFKDIETATQFKLTWL